MTIEERIERLEKQTKAIGIRVGLPPVNEKATVCTICGQNVDKDKTYYQSHTGCDRAFGLVAHVECAKTNGSPTLVEYDPELWK